MSEMFDFKNYQWRKMANNGEKWRKMAMANLPFPFVKFAISPLAPPDKLKLARSVAIATQKGDCNTKRRLQYKKGDARVV